jgi:diphthamide biosynthesis methyltransferase
MVESEAESIYERALTEEVAFLVVGDPLWSVRLCLSLSLLVPSFLHLLPSLPPPAPLSATTHTDLILRAKAIGVKVEVVHNASAVGAAASCGLQLYQFGYTVSIPLFEGSWRPDSFYHRIGYNAKGGMHTLCLLDIKVTLSLPPSVSILPIPLSPLSRPSPVMSRR